MPAIGVRRFRSTSTARALSGETYTTRQRSSFFGTGVNMIREVAARKAASVLPDPVGAKTSALSPFAIAAHPSRCAFVGASKVSANHSRTAGSNGRSWGRGLTRPS